MAESLGRGTIELVADARQLKAGIEDAKRSIRTLGDGQRDISKRASASIDQYIGKLNQQNATFGKTRRETELYKLAVRGASNEQLKAADSALRFSDAQERNARQVRLLSKGLVALAAAAGTAAVATIVTFDQLAKKAAEFQGLAEKTGDTAENIASLAVAAAAGGTTVEQLGKSAVLLSDRLTGVDDESSKAGAAIKALGINIEDLKGQQAADRFSTIAKALGQFEDSAAKSAIAFALFGEQGAQLLSFFNDLESGIGRQKILSQEQIRLADEYAKAQTILIAQTGLYAQAIATQFIPAFNDLQGAFLDIIKDIAGVEDGIQGLKNSDGIKSFADSAVDNLAFVVDAVRGVGTAFELVGNQIGGAAAAAAAFASGELRQGVNILAQIASERERILNQPSFRDAVKGRRAAREEAEAAANEDLVTGNASTKQRRPELTFRGAVKKPSGGGGPDPADVARQQARDRLQDDLAQIKRSSDAQVNALSNAEKILQARRAAALIDDQDYFAAKLGFIRLNAQEEERALQATIDRLKLETFSGKNADKDRLENQRKIAEAEQSIAKISADATAGAQVNAIQQQAALKKIEQGYTDAKEAASAYLDAIQRQNAREIAGVGRGNQFRERQAGISAIEDKLIEERRRLETELRKGQIDTKQFDTYLEVAKDTYTKEIAIYEDRSDKILEAQGEWLNGATEALNNYIDETANLAKQTEDLLTNAFQGAEDALLKFAKTGKLSFKDLIDQISTDLLRIQIKQGITGPLAELLKGDGGADSPLGAIKKFFGGGIPTKNIGIIPDAQAAEAGRRAVGAVGGAANDAAFGAAVATAGTTFAAEVTASGAGMAAELTASGASLATELVASGATITAEITAAGAAFAGEVAAAGASFAASVSTASAGSSTAGAISSAGSIFDGFSSVLDGFADGVAYVPRTGPYMLHQGERVVPAAQNGPQAGASITVINQFPQGTSLATVNQASARTGADVQRQLARFG